jgi:Ca2+-binding EF-hand superfamily protein
MSSSVWIGGIPRHCVTGEVGTEGTGLLPELRAQLDEFAVDGKLITVSVRVKDGENKSWLLATYSNASDAQRCVAKGCAVADTDGSSRTLTVKMQEVKSQITKASTGALSVIAAKHEKVVSRKKQMTLNSTRFDAQESFNELFGTTTNDVMHQQSKYNRIAFEDMDKRADGIDMLKRKLRAAQRLLPNDEGWPGLFRVYDADGSGELDHDEFRRAVRRDMRIPEHELSDNDFLRLFELIDNDNSGTISIEELSEFMRWEPKKQLRAGHALALQAGDEAGAKFAEDGLVLFVSEYIVLKRAVMREAVAFESARVGQLNAGEVVAVTRKLGNRMRVARLGYNATPTSGWVSEYSSGGAGEQLLEALPRAEWGSTADNNHVRVVF